MKNKLIFIVLFFVLLSFLSCGETKTGSENKNENPDSENTNEDDICNDDNELDDFEDSDDQSEIIYEISVETERFEGTTCRSIAIDRDNNIYIAGERHNEAYLAKINSDLKEEWRFIWDEKNWQSASSVIVVNDNVFVAGDMLNYEEVRDFGFLSKFDKNGNEIWRKNIDSSRDIGYIRITSDEKGNIYISGGTDGSLEGFENPSEDESDAIFMKFDNNGELIWMKQFGDEKSESIRDITIDSNGNIYGAGFTSINYQMHTQYIIKYDKDGNYQWDKSYGSGYIWAIEVDSKDNVFATGVQNGSIVFYEVDQGGTKISEKNYGSGVGMGLACGKDSSLYLSGYSTGESFLVKMDGSGNGLWSVKWGNGNNEQEQKVAVGPNDEIFVSYYEHILVTDDEYYDNMKRVIISRITEEVE
ncbi:MAG: SBBP repeat-containing protein [bacterium]|jgi:hypothetical protein|nr:SBBP repeat-containing protein [bacterium]